MKKISDGEYRDTARLDFLIQQTSLAVMICETPDKKGWRVLRLPNTYLTGWNRTARAAIDEAMERVDP